MFCIDVPTATPEVVIAVVPSRIVMSPVNELTVTESDVLYV